MCEICDGLRVRLKCVGRSEADSAAVMIHLDGEVPDGALQGLHGGRGVPGVAQREDVQGYVPLTNKLNSRSK